MKVKFRTKEEELQEHFWGVKFGKSVVSIKFPPVILGPEMAAPILWAPGIFWFFLLENPHAHKIPPLRGGSGFFLEGGVEVPILYLWAWGFFREMLLLFIVV